MLAVVIAQNSQRVPDEGTGIGLILLGVAIALAVAFAVFTIFRKASKNATTGAPGNTPHKSGHVGTSDPADAQTGDRMPPQRRGVEQSGSSSGS